MAALATSPPPVVRVGVACIVRNPADNGHSILIGKRKGSHGQGKWAFPGGHLEV